MIELLNHRSESGANQIYDVFQLSYKVEADLVGVEDFPPLERSSAHIQSSRSEFFGLRIGADLAAVVEFTKSKEDLNIDSLVVHPKYFRRGLASQLLQSILTEADWQYADVETAAANNPAITLYQKFGFSVAEQWMTDDGIEKVRLMKQR